VSIIRVPRRSVTDPPPRAVRRHRAGSASAARGFVVSYATGIRVAGLRLATRRLRRARRPSAMTRKRGRRADYEVSRRTFNRWTASHSATESAAMPATEGRCRRWVTRHTVEGLTNWIAPLLASSTTRAQASSSRTRRRFTSARRRLSCSTRSRGLGRASRCRSGARDDPRLRPLRPPLRATEFARPLPIGAWVVDRCGSAPTTQDPSTERRGRSSRLAGAACVIRLGV